MSYINDILKILTLILNWKILSISFSFCGPFLHLSHLEKCKAGDPTETCAVQMSLGLQFLLFLSLSHDAVVEL